MGLGVVRVRCRRLLPNLPNLNLRVGSAEADGIALQLLPTGRATVAFVRLAAIAVLALFRKEELVQPALEAHTTAVVAPIR